MLISAVAGPGLRVGIAVGHVLHDIILRPLKTARGESAGPVSAPSGIEVGSPVKASLVVGLSISSLRAGMPVPEVAIKRHPIGRLAGRSDKTGKLPNELADLPAVGRRIRKHQVHHFPATVLIFDANGGMIEATFLSNGPGPMPHGNEHHIQVPRNNDPLVGRAIGKAPMVEIVIGAISKINIANGPVDRPEGDVGWNVHVFPPPCFGVGIIGLAIKDTPVRAIRRLIGSLVFFVSVAAFDLVDVSRREIPFVEEGAIGLFDRQVKSPQVAAILIRGGGFERFIDHAKVKVVGIRAGHAGDLIGLEGQCLVEARHTTVHGGPGTCIGIDVELVPRLAVFLSIVVAGFEFAGGIEENPPLVFPAAVGGKLATDFEFDMIINHSVVNHRSAEAAVLKSRIILAVCHIDRVGDEVVDRHLVQQ